MKKPREILLARHRAVEPKLNDVRRAALDNLQRHETTSPPRLNFFTWLAEFFRLPKPALAGLALVWAIIILLNVAEPDGTPVSQATPAQMSKRPAVTREELREQRRLLSELVGTAKDIEVISPRFLPRPRGEGKPAYIYV
jgi:hypothetical protein